MIHILAAVACEHGFDIRQLLAKTNKRRVVRARRDAMHHLRDRGAPLEQIASEMGLHHATVHYHLRRER